MFDSGAGGLSVAACIHRHLPGLELVYLADNAGFPYGDKSETVVIDRCCALINSALALYPSDVTPFKGHDKGAGCGCSARHQAGGGKDD